MDIVLSAEETETLMDILGTYRSDLRMEIIDTDNPGYKRPLKHRRDVIDSIVEKLHSATQSPTEEAPHDAPSRASLRIVAVW